MQASWSHRRESWSRCHGCSMRLLLCTICSLSGRDLSAHLSASRYRTRQEQRFPSSLVPEDTKVVWLAILPLSVGPSMTLLQIVRQGLALRAAEGHQCQRPAA